MTNTEKTFVVRDVFHRPVHIQSRRGAVVVTRRDDWEDHILLAGENLTIRPRGRLVIRSLSPEAEASVSGGHWGESNESILFTGA